MIPINQHKNKSIKKYIKMQIQMQSVFDAFMQNRWWYCFNIGSFIGLPIINIKW